MNELDIWDCKFTFNAFGRGGPGILKRQHRLALPSGPDSDEAGNGEDAFSESGSMMVQPRKISSPRSSNQGRAQSAVVTSHVRE